MHFYIRLLYEKNKSIGAIVEADSPFEALNNFHKGEWADFEGYEIRPIEYYIDKVGNSTNRASIKHL